uniref:F-box domain-containing protein n=2 Tax=Caenorhabditis tropicalis TaxID=1561998 RepID=A0A1I7TTV9_9PELO
MSSFPLLQLPLIPLGIIIRQLEFHQLIALSLQFTRIHNILKLFKIPIETFFWEITRNFWIRISLNTHSARPMRFNITYDRADGATRSLKLSKGKEKIASTQDGMIVNIDCAQIDDVSRMEMCSKLTEHLLQIIKVDNYILESDTIQRANLLSENFLVWKITNRFEKIRISCSDGYELTFEDVEFLLGGVSCDHLHLNCNRNEFPDFEYNQPLVHPRITMYHCEWLKMESTLESESKKIAMSNEDITSEDLNSILRTWQDTEKLGNLEEFKIDLYDHFDMIRDQIMDGILEVEVENPKERKNENGGDRRENARKTLLLDRVFILTQMFLDEGLL